MGDSRSCGSSGGSSISLLHLLLPLLQEVQERYAPEIMLNHVRSFIRYD